MRLNWLTFDKNLNLKFKAKNSILFVYCVPIYYVPICSTKTVPAPKIQKKSLTSFLSTFFFSNNAFLVDDEEKQNKLMS